MSWVSFGVLKTRVAQPFSPAINICFTSLINNNFQIEFRYPKCVDWILLSRICRYFPVRRSCPILYTLLIFLKSSRCFLKLKNIYATRFKSWSGHGRTNRTGSAGPAVTNLLAISKNNIFNLCSSFNLLRSSPCLNDIEMFRKPNWICACKFSTRNARVSVTV